MPAVLVCLTHLRRLNTTPAVLRIILQLRQQGQCLLRLRYRQRTVVAQRTATCRIWLAVARGRRVALLQNESANKYPGSPDTFDRLLLECSVPSLSWQTTVVCSIRERPSSILLLKHTNENIRESCLLVVLFSTPTAVAPMLCRVLPRMLRCGLLLPPPPQSVRAHTMDVSNYHNVSSHHTHP